MLILMEGGCMAKRACTQTLEWPNTLTVDLGPRAAVLAFMNS